MLCPLSPSPLCLPAWCYLAVSLACASLLDEAGVEGVAPMS